MNRENVIYVRTEDLRPYKNNPRINDKAVEAVAASIKEFGFRSPIIITEYYEVINGHTRLKAAKKLGHTEVPCIVADGLTEEQIRQFRLIDNKTSEYAKWDADALEAELDEIDLTDLDFEFDFEDDLKKRKKWEKQKVACDLKDHLGLKRCNDTLYHSIFRAGKKGIPIEDIKTEENVIMFARTAEEVIVGTLGRNLDGWALVTTPRRRHKEGFHFSTEICRVIAGDLGLSFYEGAFESENNVRMDPQFDMITDPKEQNVILYDDVLTTGYTLQEVRRMLIDAGHVTFPIISIDNH